MSCLAVLDCLVSMATYSAGTGEMCRPVVRVSEHPFLDIRAGRHPCVVQTFTGGDFIPNDTIIGSEVRNSYREERETGRERESEMAGGGERERECVCVRWREGERERVCV